MTWLWATLPNSCYQDEFYVLYLTIRILQMCISGYCVSNYALRWEKLVTLSLTWNILESVVELYVDL
jgi:hypothetical protein